MNIRKYIYETAELEIFKKCSEKNTLSYSFSKQLNFIKHCHLVSEMNVCDINKAFDSVNKLNLTHTFIKCTTLR